MHTVHLPPVATLRDVVGVRGWTDRIMRGFGVTSSAARDDAALIVAELVAKAVRLGVPPVT